MVDTKLGFSGRHEGFWFDLHFRLHLRSSSRSAFP